VRFDAVTTSVSVRPADLDSVGHVNNARVLEYLEQARWNWVRHHGLDRRKGIIPVVARIEVDYRRELFWGDLSIRTALANEETVYKAVFEQVICSDDVPAVTAKVHVAFIDAGDRSIRAVAEFLDASPQSAA
jgi:YbgC/YbaW family acyl-CoA thioester hydrolase